MDGLRDLIAAEGFTLCGIAPAVDSSGHSDLVRWIEAGYASEMQYFADRIDAYRHPAGVLGGAKSIIAMAMPYPARPAQPLPIGHGKVARYAWPGVDYHDVIHPKLKRLCRTIRETFTGAAARGVVDTAPLMEREIAQLAGLGWRGKNTLLLNSVQGSYFFLACVLVDIELPTDGPQATAHCGTCTACLDACPTDAFPSAGVLDASRCISYLTIEHRGPIDPLLRPAIGDWVFGCDVCQQVCPWNRRPARADPTPEVPMERIELSSLFGISEDDFRQRFRKTPMWRTRRRGLLRNAAIVLGNQGDARSIQALTIGLHDDEAIVRGAAAWAIGQIGGRQAIDELDQRLSIETDPDVITEIDAALS
ncbi:Epoxyqueuosine reductase [Rubripirellula lacrimiformis]|uniref:Epoxyqueuosine reductase n=1 Tax=Rubripirellula lacrimiformis TaxID=1930273 RepID=A0A517N912_9BACT|nr:Epoxyqueuosine reductase [Rubripirellula lacrimiformis]